MQKSLGYSKREPGSLRPVQPTISYGEAALRLASLPERYRKPALATLRKLATIDNRPLTEYDRDTSKAKVQIDHLKKLEEKIKPLYQSGLKNIRDKEDALSSLQATNAQEGDTAQSRNYRVALERLEGFRQKVPKEQWAKYGLDDIETKARVAAKIPTGEKFASTLGEGAKMLAEQFDTAGGAVGRVTGGPVGEFLGRQVVAAINPAHTVEDVEFLRDPEYRAQINPQGTSALDFIGSGVNIWLGIGAPGAGKVLAPVGKALKPVGEAAVEGIARSKLGGTAADVIEWWKSPENLTEAGREYIKAGMSPRQAAETAINVRQAMRAASPEEIDNVWGAIVETKARAEGKAVDARLLEDVAQATSGSTSLDDLIVKPGQKESGLVPEEGTLVEATGAINPRPRGGRILSPAKPIDDPMKPVVESALKDGKRKRAKDLFQGLFRDSFSTIKSNSNTWLMKTTSRALNVAESLTASTAKTVHDAVKVQFGKLGTIGKDSRAVLGSVYKKVRDGLPTSPAERAVWRSWVEANDRLYRRFVKAGGLIPRTVGADMATLVGEDVFYKSGDDLVKMKVKSADADGLILEDGTRVAVGEPILSPSLIGKDDFFPQRLKEGVLAGLNKKSGVFRQGLYDAAAQHLLKTGQAKTLEQAEIIIDRLASVDSDVIEKMAESFGKNAARKEGKFGLSNVRSAMRRDGIKLPDAFYDDDFVSVVNDHISETAKATALLEHFGSDFSVLARNLRGLTPQQAFNTVDAISTVFGIKPASATSKALRKASGVEGVFSTVTKLGLNLGTAVLQTTAGLNTLSQFRFSSNLKGLGSLLKSSLKRLAGSDDITMLDRIHASGAVEQDIVDVMADDLGHRARKLTDNVMTITGIKGVDRFLRNHAAATGRIEAEYLVEAVKKGGRRGKAARERLRDWFEYTPEQVDQMVKEGIKGENELNTYHGGVKTQIRIRSGDVPQTVADLPIGRSLFRFQTFNYGQAKVFGDAIKEARKGRFGKLSKMLLYYSIAGEGILTAKAYANDLLDGGDRTEQRIKSLGDAWDAAKKDDNYLPLAQRAFFNTINAGMYGMYGIPFESFNQGVYSGQSGKRFVDNPLTPPVVDTGESFAKFGATLWDGIVPLAKESETEEEFLSVVRRAFGGLADDELVPFKRVWKLTHEGKTFRQTYPKPR